MTQTNTLQVASVGDQSRAAGADLLAACIASGQVSAEQAAAHRAAGDLPAETSPAVPVVSKDEMPGSVSLGSFLARILGEMAEAGQDRVSFAVQMGGKEIEFEIRAASLNGLPIIGV